MLGVGRILLVGLFHSERFAFFTMSNPTESEHAGVFLVGTVSRGKNTHNLWFHVVGSGMMSSTWDTVPITSSCRLPETVVSTPNTLSQDLCCVSSHQSLKGDTVGSVETRLAPAAGHGVTHDTREANVIGQSPSICLGNPLIAVCSEPSPLPEGHDDGVTSFNPVREKAEPSSEILTFKVVTQSGI